MKTKHTKIEVKEESDKNAPQSKPDLRWLLDAIKLPWVDLQAVIEARSKDAEALLAANRRAFEGYQEFSRKQAEILARTMQQLQSGARDVVSAKPSAGSVGRVAEQTQQVFAQMLNDWRAMAEVADRSRKDVISIVSKRAGERLQELGAALGKAG
jgi:phasin family protein